MTKIRISEVAAGRRVMRVLVSERGPQKTRQEQRPQVRRVHIRETLPAPGSR